MLLDPFEEKFYLPSITIQISDCLCWNDEVVGQEVERFDCFAVVVFDSSQRLRITFTGAGPGQENRLIAPETLGFVNSLGVSSLIQSVSLGPDDEECASLIQSKESLEVNISTVHNVKSSWLGNENVKNIDIMKLAL